MRDREKVYESSNVWNVERIFCKNQNAKESVRGLNLKVARDPRARNKDKRNDSWDSLSGQQRTR